MGFKVGNPGCPCCATCGQDGTVDSYVDDSKWTTESGSIAYNESNPPSSSTWYATTTDSNALMSRENVASVYRWAAIRFLYAYGTTGDAVVYLGLRDADGDSVRIEVAFDRQANSSYTVTVIKNEGGSDTTIDGPAVIQFNTFKDLDAVICLCYDPDYDIVGWEVNGNNVVTYGTAACSLALRDQIAGTGTCNGQLIAIGFEQYRHTLSVGNSLDLVTYGSAEMTLVLDGLDHTSTQMSSGDVSGGNPCGPKDTFKWLAEFASLINDTYSLYGGCGGADWFGDSGYVGFTADLDRYEDGDYVDTISANRQYRVLWIVSVWCEEGTTTVHVDLKIYDEGITCGDAWYWTSTLTYSDYIQFEKTFSGDKDLRELVDEEIPFVTGTGSEYLDWTGATVKLSAVVTA